MTPRPCPLAGGLAGRPAPEGLSGEGFPCQGWCWEPAGAGAGAICTLRFGECAGEGPPAGPRGAGAAPLPAVLGGGIGDPLKPPPKSRCHRGPGAACSTWPRVRVQRGTRSWLSPRGAGVGVVPFLVPTHPPPCPPCAPHPPRALPVPKAVTCWNGTPEQPPLSPSPLGRTFPLGKCLLPLRGAPRGSRPLPKSSLLAAAPAVSLPVISSLDSAIPADFPLLLPSRPRSHVGPGSQQPGGVPVVGRESGAASPGTIPSRQGRERCSRPVFPALIGYFGSWSPCVPLEICPCSLPHPTAGSASDSQREKPQTRAEEG